MAEGVTRGTEVALLRPPGNKAYHMEYKQAGYSWRSKRTPAVEPAGRNEKKLPSERMTNVYPVEYHRFLLVLYSSSSSPVCLASPFDSRRLGTRVYN
jgi:hypothetical protein